MGELPRSGEAPRRVVVVGGGVSGLGFACEAMRRRPDLELVLLEADTRVGGLVRTEALSPSVRVELGPDSMASYPGVTDAWLVALGLCDEVVHGGSAARRAFVGRAGRLEELPGSLMAATANPSEIVACRLLRATTKLRMAAEPFVSTSDSVDQESAASFLARRFGRGFVEDAMGPLLSAIYHAPVDELGAREVLGRFVELEQKHGSVSRGLRAAGSAGRPAAPALVSLRDGMAQLPRTMAEALGDRVRIGCSVARVESRGRGLRVVLHDGGTLDADAAVVTTPPGVAARMIGDMAPDAAHELAAIRSSPVETVSLLFPREAAPPRLDGTGFVLARGEARVLSALTWANRKWNHRAPDDHELLRCSVHGDDRTDRELLEALRLDLRDWLGAAGAPSAVVFDRRRVALPVHGVGHAAAMARMKLALAATPALHLLGNGIEALGVADCLRHAAAEARSLLAA